MTGRKPMEAFHDHANAELQKRASTIAELFLLRSGANADFCGKYYWRRLRFCESSPEALMARALQTI